ncbi:G2/mitotic-specific cyclin [Zygosaccharomyces mellis]|uniref:G2/mitotic-specific cyclin n=1 Tax=Zygosaccharomyces mellis TaxID=42258 RepID=A0A4C2E406_9SACH|nr:G2/mitotic-specific cyclin [Zygosaccharomyces mellis]
MSSNSENIDNTQNDRSARLLRNVQRSALNNVTNTFVSQDNVGQNTALRSLKSTLNVAKKDNSRISQFGKGPFVHPGLIGSSAAINASETVKKPDNLEDKENRESYSKPLPSIEEESHRTSGESDETTSTATVTNSSSSERQQQQQQQHGEQQRQTAAFDVKKKRPISTVVEQDVPKKFKVCDENGQEEYEWEDLDAEDANDPFMVSEYVNEIFDYLHHLEVTTLPREENLYKHRNIRQNRDILVNWLVKIHNKFGLLPETLYLAINTMDRFLCKELVQLDKLQLVGTSCLFIASKYEEVYSPSIKHFASETDGACTEDEIKEGEKFILKTLSFNLNYPNPMNFLRRISKADDYDIQSRTLAKFLLEISLMDFRFIGILPSLCAAAAMFLSRKMLGKGKWDGNLIHYSGGYTKEQLAPVCHMIMDYLVSPMVHDEFHRKYQSRRFMKASIISVQWALKVRKNGYDIMTLHE